MNKRYIILYSSFIFAFVSGMAHDAIPGIASLVQRITRGDRLTKKGLCYEREVAEFLHQQGVHDGLCVGDKAGYFDIVTDTLCIECKNIGLAPQFITTRLRKKLLEQKQKAEQLNKQFIVYFKRRIPAVLEQWLVANNIPYQRWNKDL